MQHYGDKMTEIKQRYEAWWKNDLSESPLVYLVTDSETPRTPQVEKRGVTAAEMYTDVENLTAKYRNYMGNSEYMGDAFPHLSLNLGAGSLALYLGSEPVFARDTVWFTECVEDWAEKPIKYDENNSWWKLHQEMHRRAVELAGGEYYVDIPDIVENIDILSAMRGPQNMCYDIMDCPEIVKERLKELDDIYFRYYDAIYDMVADSEGGSSYTAFHVLGKGRTAKIQCDFSAMMSPEQFREFIVPSLEKQCAGLDNSIYHLDGKDAIKHIPALMEIEKLGALQWTAGAGQPDGINEKWYPIYDAVHEAGKSKWVSVHEGSLGQKLELTKKFVERYGIKGTYFIFGHVDRKSALEIMRAAARSFK